MTLPNGASASSVGTYKGQIQSLVTPDPSTSWQYLNIPSGYNDTAQYYEIPPNVVDSLTVSGSGTIYASTYDADGFDKVIVPSGSATPASSISATGATVSTSTNTLTLSKSSVANTPQVSAGYITSGTQGNSSVSLSATVTTKGATTYYPTTSDQTIASGTYLTGTQTIKAVSQTNLEAGNIKNGTTITISNGNGNIWSVTGSYTGGGASNIVQGTFTTGATRNTTGTVSLSYTGSGYPIACFVYVDGGPYNNGTGGNTTWYNSVSRYDCGYYSMVKSRTTTAPTYTTSGADNYGTVTVIYKNSTSTATTYTRTSTMTANPG